MQNKSWGGWRGLLRVAASSNSVHESIKALARKDGISVNQFIASAASEKMASFQTLDYLRREAALGKRENFEQFLSLVPDFPAQVGDELVAIAKKTKRSSQK